MTTYDVHLFYGVRVKVSGVVATSQEEAIEIADRDFCLPDFLRGGAEDDEAAHLGAMVDEVGDECFSNSRYHEGPGARTYLKLEEEN